MRTWQKLLVGGGIGLIIGMQVLFSVLLSTPNGIRIDHPVAGRRVPREVPFTGTAWARSGIDRIEVTARAAATGTVVTVPGERLAVTYGGKVAFLLSFWEAELVLPADGDWVLSARLVTNDGSAVDAAPRTVHAAAGARVREFRPWSVEHLVPLAVLLASWIVLPIVVRRARDAKLNARIAVALTLVLWVDEIAYQVYWFALGAWSTPIALMLQMCGLSILLIPVMFFAPSEKTRTFLFEVLYFWGLGGAFQALFVPDIGMHGFPEMKYVGYFVSHGTIILSMLFAAAAWRIPLTWRSLVRVFVVTNLVAAGAWGVNQLLRFIPPWEVGNYFVLGYPPPQGSLVDVFAQIFGPAPRYMAGLEIMGIVVFALLWLPYPVARALRRRRAAIPPGPA